MHETDKKRHLGIDIKEYYDFIFDYLKSLKDVDKTVIDNILLIKNGNKEYFDFKYESICKK